MPGSRLVPKSQFSKNQNKQYQKAKNNNFPGLLICKLISTESRKIDFFVVFGLGFVGYLGIGFEGLVFGFGVPVLPMSPARLVFF